MNVDHHGRRFGNLNLNQVLPLLDYSLEHRFELRFIELMRMGHLSSDGRGCLSSSNKHYISDLLLKPIEQALPDLQQALGRALRDKQEVAFVGGALIMKSIGG